MVVDDAARVQVPDDGLRAEGEFGVVQGPGIARVVDAVDQVGIHVLAVTGRVVAHGVEDDRGMVLGLADVELGMPQISVVAIGFGRLPLVVAEVRLGEGDEHADVVRGPEDLREAQMGTRLAAIVVSVDEVDAEAFESLQAFAHGLVTGGPWPIWALSSGTADRKMRVPFR